MAYLATIGGLSNVGFDILVFMYFEVILRRFIFQVCLDNQRASQQEKDTMAVRLALQKARDVDLSSLSSATFPVCFAPFCNTATYLLDNDN